MAIASSVINDGFNVLDVDLNSKSIKAIIIEDEIRGLNNLKRSLEKNCKQVAVIGEAFSIKGAKGLMGELTEKPDVAFLDIDLPDGIIFEWLDAQSSIDFQIIFVTGYNEYAVKACKYSLIDYLEKPLDDEELVAAVGKVIKEEPNNLEQQLSLLSQIYNNPNFFEKFAISALDGIHFVKMKEMVRLEADDNYTHIFMNNGQKITTSKTIKWYEDLLTAVNFYRVHKGHIVNMNYMKKFNT